jgi:hypothetical protein
MALGVDLPALQGHIRDPDIWVDDRDCAERERFWLSFPEAPGQRRTRERLVVRLRESVAADSGSLKSGFNPATSPTIATPSR